MCQAKRVMKQFRVGATPAAVGLAIYVVGYGVSPLLFGPLSEIAVIGRNWVYIPTFFLFVILWIPTAAVDNYAGLLVLRFLTGFFGSPCLANGGASVGEATVVEQPAPWDTYIEAHTEEYAMRPCNTVNGPINDEITTEMPSRANDVKHQELAAEESITDDAIADFSFVGDFKKRNDVGQQKRTLD